MPAKMSELPVDNGGANDDVVTNGGGMTSIMENYQNKKASMMNRMNSQSSSFSSNEKQMMTSSSRVSKRSQMMRHSLSTSEMKQQSENMIAASTSAASSSENHNFSRSISSSSSSSSAAMAASSAITASGIKMTTPRGFSLDRLPIEDGMELADNVIVEQPLEPHEMKFEQKRVTQASKMKVMTDAFSAEKVSSTNQELKRLQAGDKSFEEKVAESSIKEKLETENFSAEKMAALKQEQRQIKKGENIQQEQRMAASAAMKLQTENYTAEKMAMAQQEGRQTISSQGVTHQETHVAKSTSSKLTITAKGVCTKSASLLSNQLDSGIISSIVNGISTLAIENDITSNGLDDLDNLRADTAAADVERAIMKYMNLLSTIVERLKTICEEEARPYLHYIDKMMRKAWAVPSHGHELGSSLCNVLRNNGGLDILISYIDSNNEDVQFASARVLEQCLTTENRAYIVENGLEKVVRVARDCSTKPDLECSRVGTGILEHLLKHSEATCSDLIRLGGLQAILYECRCSDVETLRHCAGALANLSLYGGSENQQHMIKFKVPVWLFPLAFHNDDNIKYYACLAIASLVANKEIEAAVLKSGTLDLVEPFITSHNPAEFANSTVAHVHGQSQNWLQRLVPVLNSKREEARSLAAFHFAMEAGIKKKQGNTNIFREIGAVEALKTVASSPNAIASKYAAQALRLINEDVPHKLSQQVPLWTVEDVIEWVKQIGFANLTSEFVGSRVDGDLLLQLTEENLKDDLGIVNGILRKRFIRELGILKMMTDYSSCDPSNLNHFLQSIGSDYSLYTYRMLHSGLDKEMLHYLTEDQLIKECSIDNSIHRLRIMEAIRLSGTTGTIEEQVANVVANKNLDAFVSYRRSNGSQLASLLKVHLQLRGFSVFIDVERLEAGKFDNNLLQSIRQAKHFLLVLTPSALDRCIGDNECKDWVHREIVAALQSQCNIIPIIDNFQFPDPEQLPEDMRAINYFNGVRWIHDYQDACVDKLERFMRGEMNARSDVPVGRMVAGGAGTPGTPSTIMRNGLYQRSQSNESKGSFSSDKDSKETNESFSSSPFSTMSGQNGQLPPVYPSQQNSP